MIIPKSVKTEKKLINGPSSGEELPVFIARPDEDVGQASPALLLFQEAFGVNDHIQDVCQRFAKQGYVVVAPDVYYHHGHWQTFQYDDIQSTTPLRESLTEKVVLADIQCVLDYMHQRDDIDDGRIGTIGYCLGGRLSFMTACYFSDRIKTSVVYYGGGINKSTPQFPKSPLSLAHQIEVPILGFFGGKDKGIPEEVVREIESTLKQAQVENEIHFYPPAQHGFFCDRRQSYDPESAHDAWYHTVQWFNKLLFSL